MLKVLKIIEMVSIFCSNFARFFKDICEKFVIARQTENVKSINYSILHFLLGAQ